jgi:hypothetical protein
MCYVFHLLRALHTVTQPCLFIRASALKKFQKPVCMSKQPNRGKRDRSIQFWCDDQEFKRINQQAEQTGISRGNYCRQVVLGDLPQHTPHGSGAVTRQEVKQLHKELRAIGINLNQLSKHANATHELPHLKKIETGIEAFNKLNRAILEVLR